MPRSYTEDPEPTYLLTPRQRQALEWYGQGLGYKEIGQRMGIAFQSVRNHLAAARISLGARNSTHALTICYQHGLIHPPGYSPPPPVPSEEDQMMACLHLLKAYFRSKQLSLILIPVENIPPDPRRDPDDEIGTS